MRFIKLRQLPACISVLTRKNPSCFNSVLLKSRGFHLSITRNKLKADWKLNLDFKVFPAVNLGFEVSNKKKKPETETIIHMIPPGPSELRDEPVLERTNEIALLSEHFSELHEKTQASTAVYLKGLPGSGKSELARQFANQMKSTHDFVGVLDIRDFPDCYRELARRLGVPSLLVDRPLFKVASEIRARLSKLNWVLVIDNFNSLDIKGRKKVFTSGMWYIIGSFCYSA